MVRAFAITYTLRFAIRRLTNKVWQTRARWRTVNISTLRVRAARWRVTWIFNFNRFFTYNVLLLSIIHILARTNLRIGIHLMKGSPVCLGAQLQIGLWFTTWHRAFIPQVPGHGSIHFWFTQAWLSGHSELETHSGLQVGGLPIKPGTQEQTAWPLTSLHWLLGPHGDGLQGFCRIGSTKIRTLYPSTSLIWKTHQES